MAKKQVTYKIGFDVEKNSLQQAQEELKKIRQLTEQDYKLIIDPSATTEQFKQVQDQAKLLGQILEESFNPKLNTINLDTFRKKLDEQKTSLSQLSSAFTKSGDMGSRAFRNVAATLLTTKRETKETYDLFTKLGETFSNTVKWKITSSAIDTVTGSIQKAWGYAKKLDSSLNDIRIVTGQSADQMERFAKKANEAAKSLGSSTTSYTNAALIYYQQGLGETDVQSRTQATIKAANVTGQSAAEVSQQLTAVWNGYKVVAEEAELYVDKLAAVAATTAADLEELSDGMSKVASAANTMGVNVDQLAAQLSTIVSVTKQDASAVGTALKTIYARMGDLEVSGVDEFGTTLGDVSGKLQQMGIQVLDQNGNLREMGTVMEEVAAKWGTWTSAQQQAAAVAMAGKRQYNNLIALFENWSMYEGALSTSENSEGTLQAQQNIYMESLEAHLERISTAGEKVYAALFDSESMKDTLDLVATLVEDFGTMIENIGGGGNMLLMFGSIASRVLGKEMGAFAANTVKNFQNLKYNAAQAKAEISIIDDLRAENINQEKLTQDQVNELIKLRERQLKVEHLLTEEEKKRNHEQLIGLARSQEEFNNLQDELQIMNESLDTSFGFNIGEKADAATTTAKDPLAEEISKKEKRVTEIETEKANLDKTYEEDKKNIRGAEAKELAKWDGSADSTLKFLENESESSLKAFNERSDQLDKEIQALDDQHREFQAALKERNKKVAEYNNLVTISNEKYKYPKEERDKIPDLSEEQKTRKKELLAEIRDYEPFQRFMPEGETFDPKTAHVRSINLERAKSDKIKEKEKIKKDFEEDKKLFESKKEKTKVAIEEEKTKVKEKTTADLASLESKHKDDIAAKDAESKKINEELLELKKKQAEVTKEEAEKNAKILTYEEAQKKVEGVQEYSQKLEKTAETKDIDFKSLERGVKAGSLNAEQGAELDKLKQKYEEVNEALEKFNSTEDKSTLIANEYQQKIKASQEVLSKYSTEILNKSGLSEEALREVQKAFNDIGAAASNSKEEASTALKDIEIKAKQSKKQAEENLKRLTEQEAQLKQDQARLWTDTITEVSGSIMSVIGLVSSLSNTWKNIWEKDNDLSAVEKIKQTLEAVVPILLVTLPSIIPTFTKVWQNLKSIVEKNKEIKKTAEEAAVSQANLNKAAAGTGEGVETSSEAGETSTLGTDTFSKDKKEKKKKEKKEKKKKGSIDPATVVTGSDGTAGGGEAASLGEGDTSASKDKKVKTPKGGKKFNVGGAIEVAATVAVAAAAMGAMAYDYASPLQAAKKELNAAIEASQSAQENFKLAADEYKNLQDTFTNYDKASKAIDKMVKGTQEWRDAVRESNDQVLELLQTYPELADEVMEIDGQLILSEKGQEEVLRKEKEEMTQARLAQGVAKSQVLAEQNDKIIAENGETAPNLTETLVAEGVVGALAGGVASGFAIGAWGGPIGALVGAAAGLAVAGVSMAATAHHNKKINEEFKDNYGTAVNLVAKQGDHLLENEDVFANAMKEAGITDEEVIKALYANKDQLAKNAAAVEANTEIMSMQDRQNASDWLSMKMGAEYDNASAEKKDALARAVAARSGTNSEEYKSELEDQKELFEDKEDGAEASKKYAELTGIDYKTVDWDKENGTATFTMADGSTRVATKEEMAQALAADKVKQNIDTSAITKAYENINKLTTKVTKTEKVTDTDGKEKIQSTQETVEIGKVLSQISGSETDLSFSSQAEIDALKNLDVGSLGISEDDLKQLGFESLDDYKKAVEDSIKLYESATRTLTSGMSQATTDAFKQMEENIEDFSLTAKNTIANNLEDAYNKSGSTAVNVFKEIQSQNKNMTESQMIQLSTALKQIDFNAINSQEQVRAMMKEIGLSAENESVIMQMVANEIDTVAQRAIYGLDALKNQLRDLSNLTDDLKIGDVLSDEDYQRLIDYNAEWKKYFVLTKDGYKYIGGGSADFKNYQDKLLNPEELIEQTDELVDRTKDFLASDAAKKYLETDENGVVSIKTGETEGLEELLYNNGAILEDAGVNQVDYKTNYDIAQGKSKTTIAEWDPSGDKEISYKELAEKSAEEIATFFGQDATNEEIIKKAKEIKNDAIKKVENAETFVDEANTKVLDLTNQVSSGAIYEKSAEALEYSLSGMSYKEIQNLNIDTGKLSKEQLKSYDKAITASLNEEAAALGISVEAWEAYSASVDNNNEKLDTYLESVRELWKFQNANMYYEIDTAIQQLTNDIEDLSNAQGKLVGKAVLDNLDEQIAKQVELQAKEQERYELKKKELDLEYKTFDTDVEKLKENGVAITTNSDGTISNDTLNSIMDLAASTGDTYYLNLLKKFQDYNDKILTGIDEYNDKMDSAAQAIVDAHIQAYHYQQQAAEELRETLKTWADFKEEFDGLTTSIDGESVGDLGFFDKKGAADLIEKSFTNIQNEKFESAGTLLNALDFQSALIGRDEEQLTIAAENKELEELRKVKDAALKEKNAAEQAEADLAAKTKRKAELEALISKNQADMDTLQNEANAIRDKKFKDGDITKKTNQYGSDKNRYIEEQYAAWESSTGWFERLFTNKKKLKQQYADAWEAEQVIVNAHNEKVATNLNTNESLEKQAAAKEIAINEFEVANEKAKEELAKIEGEIETLEKQGAGTAASAAASKYNEATKAYNEKLEAIQQRRQETDPLLLMDDATFKEEFNKTLEEAKSTLQGLKDELQGLYDNYLAAQAELMELYDKEIEKLNGINSILSKSADLAKLAGKNASTYYAQMTANATKSAELAKIQLAVAEAEYQKVLDLGDSASEEMLETTRANLQKATEAVLDSTQAQMDAIAQQFSIGLQETLDAAINAAYEGEYGSLANLSEAWDLETKKDDRYLDEVNETYAVDKMNRNFQKSIDETDNIAAKNKLLEKQATIEQKLADIKTAQGKLTQADLDRANAEYELTLKQIALEEAQQTANKMKLTRDASGNYSYQYVADQDAIAKAEEELAEAENNLYNMEKDRTEALVGEYYSTMTEANSAISEAVAAGDEERVARLKEYYGELLTGIQAELGTSSDAFARLGGEIENWQVPFENFTSSIANMNLDDLFGADGSITDMINGMFGDEGSITTLQSEIGELLEDEGPLSIVTTQLSEAVSDTGVLIEESTKIMDATEKVINQLPGLLIDTKALSDSLNEVAKSYTNWITALNNGSNDPTLENTEAIKEHTKATLQLIDSMDGLKDGMLNGIKIEHTGFAFSSETENWEAITLNDTSGT